VTLQPLFVILAGAILGARGGAISMAAYVTVGALGWPVFSNGGAGIGWLLGPTGGYLLAAPAAAYIAGSLSQVQRAAWVGLLGLSLGVATMYAGGVLQLMAVTGRPLAEAFALGAVPFFVGDVTKVVLAFLVLLASRRVRRAEG
jgi:biotin transport system substrate-specific component